jgi:hypothetical protein
MTRALIYPFGVEGGAAMARPTVWITVPRLRGPDENRTVMVNADAARRLGEALLAAADAADETAALERAGLLGVL